MADTLDLAIDPKLLAEAEGLGVDVVQEIEIHLRNRIAKRKREIAWQEQNREAIKEQNEWIEQHGLWYERLRDS